MKKLLRSGFLFTVGLLATSCYTLREGWQLLSIYSAGKSFDKSLADPTLSDPERKLILTAEKIKKFAVNSLGLKENKNYTKLVRTDRKYLTNVVSAAESDAFRQYLWDYPVVGKMPYQGYFRKANAEIEADRLKKLGLDVLIRPVDAFSTLGFFSDPLFSYMSAYTEPELADLLIHEQTHATIFLDGQGDFNENLAVFIGGKGSLEYLKSVYGEDSDEVRKALGSRADALTFRNKLHELYLELDAVYRDSSLDRNLKLARKAEVIDAFQKDYAANYDRDFQTPDWKGFSQIQINNAYLMTYRNYVSGQDDFEAFYEKTGSNLPKMIAALKKLSKQEKDPLGWMKRYSQ